MNRAAHYQAMPQLMVPSIIAERSRPAIPLAKFSLRISTYILRASITSKSIPTSCSLIDVTGTANLAGVLEVTQDPGSYSSSGQYTILQTTGGITGAFDSIVIHSLPGYQFHLENNGYTLSLIYEFIPLPPTNLQGKSNKKSSSLIKPTL